MTTLNLTNREWFSVLGCLEDYERAKYLVTPLREEIMSHWQEDRRTFGTVRLTRAESEELVYLLDTDGPTYYNQIIKKINNHLDTQEN